MVFIPAVNSCTLIKVSSGEEKPWPDKPPSLRYIIEEMRALVRKNGGAFKWRFQDGVCYILIRKLSEQWVSDLAGQWRKAIKKRREVTKVELIQNGELPPRGPKVIEPGRGTARETLAV